jgi:CRP-like cAMP-binding protein|mmetsp:Transcript_32433/g.5874  ORF Transcript_32433/g.5874 Transcript_32433/m.5874 type:complete len:90 (+) Transcript_32433:253-522(+)
MLRRVEYFKFLADEMMEELIYSMDPTFLEPDSYLFLPGKQIDEAIFIISGQIELSFTLNDKNLHAYKRRSKRINIEYFNPNDKIPRFPA